jgi:hypothetical protein
MPINPSALSSPEPDPIPPQDTSGDAPTSVPATDAEQPQRKRRTKKELTDAAVVPAPDAPTEVKDAGTGAKVMRPWSEAVALVKANQAEFVDKTLKYAVLKMEQEPVVASSAFAQPAQPSEDPSEREVRYTVDGQALLKVGAADGLVSYSDEHGERTMRVDEWELLSMSPPPRDGGAVSSNVPPDAELGDEVRVGAETMRVGHGGVLTTSPVAVDGEMVKPKRRWQRELGSGPNGPWQSTTLTSHVAQEAVDRSRAVTDSVQSDVNEMELAAREKDFRAPVFNENGNGVTVQSEHLPVDYEQVGPAVWKIGTGFLEKIGMPDYSSFQIGPITASRTVIDDGRRSEVVLKGKTKSIPTACVEVGVEASDICEFIGSYQRGELVSFLQSTGALKQPVS